MSEQDHKVVIVTGGSRGIGAGVVAEYRRRGWAVVAVSRTVKPAGDPAVLTVEGDVSELGASTGWTDPGEDEVRIETARYYPATLEPLASGVYVNVLGDEGAAGVRRAYTAEKLSRLTVVKDTYDPQNIFHLNQNL